MFWPQWRKLERTEKIKSEGCEITHVLVYQDIKSAIILETKRMMSIRLKEIHQVDIFIEKVYKGKE